MTDTWRFGGGRGGSGGGTGAMRSRGEEEHEDAMAQDTKDEDDATLDRNVGGVWNVDVESVELIGV